MNLLVILAIGATLGWLAGLLTRSPGGHGLAANIGVGLAGALISGAMASSTALLEGFTPESIGGTLVGTAVLLGAVNMLWREHQLSPAKARLSPDHPGLNGKRPTR